jgi:hypothetical protein
MNAELSFESSADAFGSSEATACFSTDPHLFAGGVQWLGRAEPRNGRRYGYGHQQQAEPLILGSAHGPRLLELVRMAG